MATIDILGGHIDINYTNSYRVINPCFLHNFYYSQKHKTRLINLQLLMNLLGTCQI